MAGAIPFIIVFFLLSFFIKNGDGVRYFKVYDNWYGSTPSLHWLSEILGGLGNSWGFIGVIIALIVSIVLFFIIPAIVILLPLCLIGSTIYTVHSCIGARANIKKIPGQLEYQSSKLDSLKADIGKVKDKVDWLAW